MLFDSDPYAIESEPAAQITSKNNKTAIGLHWTSSICAAFMLAYTCVNPFYGNNCWVAKDIKVEKYFRKGKNLTLNRLWNKAQRI